VKETILCQQDEQSSQAKASKCPYQQKKKSTQGWLDLHSTRTLKEERHSCVGRVTGSRSRSVAADAVVAHYVALQRENSALLAMPANMSPWSGYLSRRIYETGYHQESKEMMESTFVLKKEREKKRLMYHVLKPV